MKSNKSQIDWYTERVEQLEAEGLCTSDAQSIVDIEEINQTIKKVTMNRAQKRYEQVIAYLRRVVEPQNGATIAQQADSDLEWIDRQIQKAYDNQRDEGVSLFETLGKEADWEIVKNVLEIEGIDPYERPDVTVCWSPAWNA